MKTERMMQPSAYSPTPRRRRGDAHVAKDGLEALATARAPIEGPMDVPVNAVVKHLRAIVEQLLEQTPGDALCDACLAFAAEAPLIDMRHATGVLPQTRPGMERGTGRCVSCRRETVVTVYRTTAAV